MTRDEAARAFAERMGWYVLEQLVPGGTNLILDPMFVCGFVTNDRGLPRNDLPLPAPDAPLHEHLAFVGRVAEAIGSAFPFVATAAPAYMNPRVIEYSVGFGDPGIPTSVVYTRPDLSHAALLAALAALEER